ncbi:MAG: 2-hydroxyacyl-CoA dehydratase family protein [Nanoarchaeota archaeon]|nr:2-hydroxyacyl-CoA dehydratase family protein [Nanoarchaeota archaeon]
METTIRLSNNVKEKLDTFKVHSRESYNDVIARITENSKVKIDEESLKETIEVLSDPETMRDIAEALEEINKGNYGTPLDEIEKELGL